MATLSDLARATGAKPRTVQLWADAGVIVPEVGTDHEGPGRHREFSKGETIVACIVAPFAADRMAISGLIPLARVVREFVRDKETRAFDQAINGVGNNFLLVSSGRFAPVKVTMEGGPSGRMTHEVALIEDDEARHPFGEFMAFSTRDFPMVRILSLSSVLKPISAIKF